MDWSKGFSSSYHMTIVDPVTWRDIERREITSGKISKVSTGLRCSADIECTDFDPGREYWIRIWLTAKQWNNTEPVALFTGIASTSETKINGKLSVYPVQCYSVLKPAADKLLERGWYAPIETSGAMLIKNLLSVCGAPIEIDDGAPVLSDAIIAESGETNLSMADKILTAIGWRMVLQGDGTIRIRPESNDVVAIFDPIRNDIVEPEVTLSRDWFDCPNCFRAIQEDLSATAKDEDDDSFLSVQNRGREIWMEEDGCDFADNETIGEYAVRRLKEEQRVALIVSYRRRFHPDINVGDVVRLNYPGQGIEGSYTVNRQDIELGHGAAVDEEVVA